MITLETIRNDMVAQLKRDQELQSVEVNADSIEEALADAAVQFDTRAVNLEYEVVEKGSAGFLGLNKKPWKLKIYQNPETILEKKKSVKEDIFANDSFDEEEKVVDQDGLYYIHRFNSGINLKVLLPIGAGKPLDIHAVLHDIKRADTISFDEDKIKELVKKGTDNEYVVVGDFKHIKAGDASFVIDITKDEMLATITAQQPTNSGAEISSEQIVRQLESFGVVAGIEKEKIEEFVDNPVYNSPCEVAAAVKPVDGRDAFMDFKFETDSSKIRIKENEAGLVNFKEQNRIQNVIEGQPLAQKIPAERGKAGKTLYGKYLEAKNGKDIKIPLGKNVKLDSDNCTVLSTINGRVFYETEKINVEPVIEYDAVNIKTGNIEFLGTVIVKGSVDDGFDIIAQGNIEIGGTVGKCHLKADGDIIVSGGITGHDEGVIQAGKSLWCKFIQNTRVEVEEYCIVSDSIMNSEVTSMKRIILNGKRAQITGGKVFAVEEIAAKNIGSPGGGTATQLEVGFNPRKKMRLSELQEEQETLVREIGDVENNLTTLENQKKARRSLPTDKEKMYNELKERRREIKEKTAEITDEIESIIQELHDLKVIGKVKASGTVYSGVTIFVRDAKDEIRTEVKSVTFFFEQGFVRRGKYEEPDMEGIKVPDGYSTY